MANYIAQVFSVVHNKSIGWIYRTYFYVLFSLQKNNWKVVMSLITTELRYLYRFYNIVTLIPLLFPYYKRSINEDISKREESFRKHVCLKWLPYIFSRLILLVNLTQYMFIGSSMILTFVKTKKVSTFELLVVHMWAMAVFMIYMADILLLGKCFRIRFATLMDTCDRVWASVDNAVYNGLLMEVRKAKNYKLNRIIFHLW